ncbi:MAG: pyridine nucleotide-disulfide oxidoreductase, partial [Muribaculaceae bacterium]|nr:pyridine nucleotide-disulfide oxidoreductase [Muribaculaceae bacterium]
MKIKLLLVSLACSAALLSDYCYAQGSNQSTLWIEAESFSSKGGWVVDQQYMDIMGSPYLMAHGLGNPVIDATTDIDVPVGGKYHIFVRTY